MCLNCLFRFRLEAASWNLVEAREDGVIEVEGAQAAKDEAIGIEALPERGNTIVVSLLFAFDPW